MEDRVEVVSALHPGNGDELHFRYIGQAKGREFVVNLQCSAADTLQGERLRPEEYDFLVAKILEVILANIAEKPNPGLR